MVVSPDQLQPSSNQTKRLLTIKTRTTRIVFAAKEKGSDPLKVGGRPGGSQADPLVAVERGITAATNSSLPQLLRGGVERVFGLLHGVNLRL